MTRLTWLAVASVAYATVRSLPPLVIDAMGWVNRAKREARA